MTALAPGGTPSSRISRISSTETPSDLRIPVNGFQVSNPYVLVNDTIIIVCQSHSYWFVISYWSPRCATLLFLIWPIFIGSNIFMINIMLSSISPKAKRRLEMDPTSTAVKRRRLSSTSTSDEGRKFFNCFCGF